MMVRLTVMINSERYITQIHLILVEILLLKENLAWLLIRVALGDLCIPSGDYIAQNII